jgi:uncharacterized membrane protein
MNEPKTQAARPAPWVLRQVGRFFASAVAGGGAGLLTTALPQQTRIIFGLDVFLVSFVVLTYVLMSTATQEQCALLAEQRAPIRHTALIASILVTLVGIAAIAALLHSQKNQVGWLRLAHLLGSMVALFFGWITAQMTFALQYMRIYYRNFHSRGGADSDPGLVFPGEPTPDLWDFMYYSFTIAMCFQTSDVSVSDRVMRRLTLMHAIYSFLFVATIIGFVVNVLSSLA